MLSAHKDPASIPSIAKTRHGAARLQSQHSGGGGRRIRSLIMVILAFTVNLRPVWAIGYSFKHKKG